MAGLPHITFVRIPPHHLACPPPSPPPNIAMDNHNYEGAIITRDRDHDDQSNGTSSGIWRIDTPTNWFRLETNDDHWKPAEDQRRRAGNAHMHAVGRAAMTLTAMYEDVLSVPPNLATSTTYTSIFSASLGMYTTTVREPRKTKGVTTATMAHTLAHKTAHTAHETKGVTTATMAPSTRTALVLPLRGWAFPYGLPLLNGSFDLYDRGTINFLPTLSSQSNVNATGEYLFYLPVTYISTNPAHSVTRSFP